MYSKVSYATTMKKRIFINMYIRKMHMVLSKLFKGSQRKKIVSRLLLAAILSTNAYVSGQTHAQGQRADAQVLTQVSHYSDAQVQKDLRKKLPIHLTKQEVRRVITTANKTVRTPFYKALNDLQKDSTQAVAKIQITELFAFIQKRNEVYKKRFKEEMHLHSTVTPTKENLNVHYMNAHAQVRLVRTNVIILTAMFMTLKELELQDSHFYDTLLRIIRSEYEFVANPDA